MASPSLSPSLDSLAASIPDQIAKISKLLQAANLPSPTLHESGAVDIATQKAESQELTQARNELINQANNLLYLARGPVDHVVTLGYHAVDTADLGIVSRFGIPSKIPIGATVSLAELSTATGLPENELARTVRYAITKGLFTEPEPGKFGHSAASATLAKNQGLADLTVFNSGFSTRIVVCLADQLWAKHGLKRADAPEAAFNESYPGYVNLFDYMGQKPDESREYFNYLDGRAGLPRYATSHLLNSWDWAAVGLGTVIDCGGSSGAAAMEVAKRVPNAKVIVQDINVEGLNMGRELTAKDAQLAGRIEFVEHDLFNPQTIPADVYFFRHVLHDWGDDECIKMLRQLLPAIKDGSRILLSEGVMAESGRGTTVLLEDMHVLWDDHVMMAAHNARERTISEYTKLFEAADPGYSFVNATGALPGMHHMLLEYKYTKKAA